jgi:predicted adenine nucleotide alpha hydrolase (AANH) superfamily ATPase
LRELTKENNSVTGFFYNPNIHPYAEMEKRRHAVADYAGKEGLEVIFADYDMENFFKNISTNIESPLRCHICWKMRLYKTAQYAKDEGYSAFTTTLLVSPYQDRQAIVKIGSELNDKLGIEFIDTDWRGGFRTVQQFAREQNIYRQKYCGCIFSEKERFQKAKNHPPTLS